MKSFEECYSIFEGGSIDAWHYTSGLGARMKFRNTEFYANIYTDFESFINTLKNNWLCYVLFEFDTRDPMNESRKCIKRLHKACPELFNGETSYNCVIANIKPWIWKYGLVIRKGSICEMISKNDVTRYMHHVSDNRKAYVVRVI
ncbi:MAG: hypothetical protein IKU29_00745 [Parabacteroides sp.]|nr:hypothetical protein [Parabacteroides sp.]